jgi:hypothetical protein
MKEIIHSVDGYNVIEYEKTCIYFIENIIDNKLCEDFIQLIHKLNLKTTDKYFKGSNVICDYISLNSCLNINDELFYKFSTDPYTYKQLMSDCKNGNTITTNFMNGIRKDTIKTYISILDEKLKIISEIMQHINGRIKLDSHCGYNLRKIYGETRPHADGTNALDEVSTSNLNFITEQGNYNRDFISIRNSTIIFALNDDYNGGEFSFPYYDVSFKLKKGSVLLFPPYWTHVHTVRNLEEKNYRYTINTWSYEKYTGDGKRYS